MKHFNWDCDCPNCKKMKAAPAMYEALKAYSELGFTKQKDCAVISLARIGEVSNLVEQALKLAEGEA